MFCIGRLIISLAEEKSKTSDLGVIINMIFYVMFMVMVNIFNNIMLKSFDLIDTSLLFNGFISTSTF
jgi:hypothetical protein